LLIVVCVFKIFITFAAEYQESVKMKRLIMAALLSSIVIGTLRAQDVMSKQKDGTYVVNTTTLAQDVEGYNGPTPLEVYIKKNKIVKVLMLKSQETPKYVARIKKLLLPKFEGMKIGKGKLEEVDGVTEATFTSDAVKENVARGVDYYKQHK
jgi:electron transport complex protein RnfG